MNKITVLLGLCVILIFSNRGPSATLPLQHVRGLWVVRNTLTSAGKIDTLLSFAREYDITDLFVQVRGRGDAYYNSKYEPRANNLADGNFDPLGYLLSQSVNDSLRIHAWLNVFYVWSEDTLPGNGNHIVRRRADWLARPLNQPDMIFDYPSSAKKAQTEGLYISPMQQEAQKYFIGLVEDILSKYAIDGIHLDYIRYPNQRFDLHPDVVRGFRRRYVLNPNQFLLNPEGFAQKFSIAGYESFFLQWRKYLLDGLSDFVRKLSGTIRAHSDKVIISAAVKPDIAAAHWDFYQDWDRWLREGWLDYAVPMNYTPDSELFQRRIDSYLEKLPADKYLVGIALYNQTPEASIPKIARVMALGNAGFVLFSYNQLPRQKKVADFIKYGFRKNP